MINVYSCIICSGAFGAMQIKGGGGWAQAARGVDGSAVAVSDSAEHVGHEGLKHNGFFYY